MRYLYIGIFFCLWNIVLVAQSNSYEGIEQVVYQDLALAKQKAIQAEQEAQTIIELAEAVLGKALVAHSEGNYTAAIRWSTMSLHLYDSLNNQQGQITAYQILGAAQGEKGSIDRALEYHTQALRLADSTTALEAKARSNQYLGADYLALRDWQNALYYVNNALMYYDKTNDTLLRALTTIDKGRIFHYQNQPDSAAFWFQQAIALTEDGRYPYAQAQANRAWGAWLLFQNNYDEARRYYTQASQQFLETNHPLQRARTLQGLGEIETEVGNIEIAIEHLQSSLNIAKSLRAKILGRDVHLDLYRAYLNKLDYEQALIHYRKYTAAKESILNEESQQIITEIEAKYQNEKLAREKLELAEENQQKNQELEAKNQEIEVQNLRNSRNRTVIIGMIIGIVLLLVIIWLVSRQWRLRAMFRENEWKQRALRAQMNPHFIFNSLNSIQSLIATNDNASASLYLARFSRMVRQILQQAQQPWISLRAESKFLTDYIELEKRRLKSGFDYEILLDEDLDEHWLEIPTFILQPFVENAILHGLMRKTERGSLLIHFQEHEPQVLKCIIEDDGIGRTAAKAFKKQTIKEHESLGIKLTEQRLQNLMNRMKLKVDNNLINIVDLYDEEQQAVGTRIELLLPVQYSNQASNL